jgi:hypothetical protein
MSHWWRAHDEAVDDPKLGLLSDRLHRCWFNLMCLTSGNGGKLPAIDIVAFKLRVTEHKAAEIITALVAAGLIDRRDDGFIPHNWETRQFKSDVTDPTNATRQKRYRDRHAVTANSVTETVTVTPPILQTTETDSEKKTDSRAVATATRPKVDSVFDEFWKAYPRREGANPRKPALAAFTAKLKAGTDAADIIAGAKACAVRDREKVGTPFIPQAVRWLRDERWRDYLTAPTTSNSPQGGWRPGLPTSEELRAKYARSEPNGEGKNDSVDQTAPVDESSARLRNGEPGLFCGGDRLGGIQKLGDVLSGNGLGTVGVPGSGEVPDRRGDAGVDSTMPMAGMARDRH